MARLADLQRKIDEATVEVRHLAQDEQNRRPQHRELHQEGLFNEDGWYDDFNHDTFTFESMSLLTVSISPHLAMMSMTSVFMRPKNDSIGALS